MKKDNAFMLICRMVMLTIVGLLFNFSIICLAVVILLITLYLIKGNWSFVENASYINIMTLLVGVIIFIPIYILRRKLKKTDC